MRRRAIILGCLGFSGFSALVYQLIWTRLLGFSFGTSTEAIATVLAVFFGGLALGNGLAARELARVRRPLLVYAGLEAWIGLYALVSLPLLGRIDALFGWIGVPETSAGLLAVRAGAAAVLLLPPTIAMGATLPVVARSLVDEDGAVGRWSAHLYAANTLGAVLGAYLCGFWLIPQLGLTRAVAVASAANLAAAALVWRLRGRDEASSLPARAPDPVRQATSPGASGVYLLCFGISGFVAIGYEIVWSKIFGIVMEGTLYGFAAVLSAYLLGIGAGSALIAGRVDRIRDLPRCFALLHVAIGIAVVVGMAAVPYLPFGYEMLARWMDGADAVHLLYLLVVPIVLLPTALFGAAFPILIRMHARNASHAGRSVGIATAVNTSGSIAASLLVGFWWIPAIGIDGSLYGLLMIDFAAALLLLIGFQLRSGRAWLRPIAGTAAVVGTIALSYGGVGIDAAIAGRQLHAPDLESYLRGLERDEHQRAVTIEGRSSLVSVYATPESRLLRTNGLPEAGLSYARPYVPLESALIGVIPYALAREAARGLVIGLGGGNTVNALTRTRLESIDVVELERGVVRAAEILYEGRPSPLADPRVSLRIADGRNDLLMRAFAGAPGYDVITSQPSHPWRVGAANLFTEDFFRVARASLREGGVFATWLNGFRIDGDSLLAVVTSFERVFPGALVFDVSSKGRMAFLLAGSTEPIALDVRRLAARLEEPELARSLRVHEFGGGAELIARLEGPARAFASIDPSASNTDDNAFVETRTPRALSWQQLDFGAVEERLPESAPLLPEIRGSLDPGEIARAILAREGMAPWPYRAVLERFLVQVGDRLPKWQATLFRAEADLRIAAREADALARLRALAAANPTRPEPLRALGLHLAERRSAWRAAADAFAAAYQRSGATSDAYDAGRALHPIDRGAAWQWLSRIPEAERDDHPRLAYYAAARALETGATREVLRARYRALRTYLDSEAGRTYPGAHEVASRLAWALGDTLAARAHADADAAARAKRARPLLARAEAALEAGRIDAAAAVLDEAVLLAPGDPRVTTLAADLAVARGSADEIARALERLRHWSPTVDDGTAAENHFRTRHRLPLLPELPERRPRSRPLANPGAGS